MTTEYRVMRWDRDSHRWVPTLSGYLPSYNASQHLIGLVRCSSWQRYKMEQRGEDLNACGARP